METQTAPKDNKKRTLILSVIATVVMVGGFALYYFSKYDALNQDNLKSFIQDFDNENSWK